MEGLAAFSLACNVLQTISFARETVSLVRQTYQHGSSVDNAELDNTSSRLADLMKLVDKPSNSPQRPGTITPAEKEVRQLASKCCDVVRDLQSELSKLKAQGGKLESFGKGIRAALKRSDMERIEKRLTKYQELFGSGLLLRLREQNNALALSQAQGFDRLDDKLKSFILELTGARSAIIDHVTVEANSVRQVAASEHINTRAHLEKQITELKSDAVTTTQREILLKSLRWDDTFTRYNQISETSFDTFEWIFNDHPASSWPSFARWLREGNDMYWIQGKAGSGKSTLMKFIIEHDKVSDLITTWRPHATPKPIAHFFWLNGSPSQRTLHGLLCSLLYQTVEHDTDLVDWLITNGLLVHRKQSPADWSVKDLAATLDKVWQQALSRRPLCVFLDGLDEFGDEPNFQRFIDMLHHWRSLENLKLCVSCRPEWKIDQQFQGVSLMRLQDLTRPDIKSYAEGVLKDVQGRLRWKIDQQTMTKITDEIFHAASGVFLWVRLALNDVTRGLTNQDSWEELKRRISRLPKDVYDLYEDMLTRTGEDREISRREAILYIKTCIMSRDSNSEERTRLSLLSMLFIQNNELCRQGFERPPDVEDLLHKCQHVEQRLSLCCGGMIELRKRPYPQSIRFNDTAKSDPSMVRLLNYNDLEFVVTHRTVFNYFATPSGLKLLEHCNIELSTIYLSIVRATLVCVRGYFALLAPTTSEGWVSKILWRISELGYKLGVGSLAKESAISLLEEVLLVIYGWSNNIRSSAEQRQLEFEFSKAGWHLDFLGGILSCDLPCSTLPELNLEHEGPTPQLERLTPEYLAYLLPCATEARVWSLSGSELQYTQRYRRMWQLVNAGADVNARRPTAVGDLMPTSPLVAYIYNLNLSPSRDIRNSDVEAMLNLYRRRGACFDQQTLIICEIAYLNTPKADKRLELYWQACHDLDVDLFPINENRFTCLCVGAASFLLQQILRQGQLISIWDRLQIPIKLPTDTQPYLLCIPGRKGPVTWKLVDPVHAATLQEILTNPSKDWPEDYVITTLRRIHAQSEEVDVKGWAVQNGWLLTPEHPLYPKGPIKRFRDEHES